MAIFKKIESMAEKKDETLVLSSCRSRGGDVAGGAVGVAAAAVGVAAAAVGAPAASLCSWSVQLACRQPIT